MHFSIIIPYTPLKTTTEIKLRALNEYTMVKCDFLDNGKICIHSTSHKSEKIIFTGYY